MDLDELSYGFSPSVRKVTAKRNTFKSVRYFVSVYLKEIGVDFHGTLKYRWALKRKYRTLTNYLPIGDDTGAMVSVHSSRAQGCEFVPQCDKTKTKISAH